MRCDGHQQTHPHTHTHTYTHTHRYTHLPSLCQRPLSSDEGDDAKRELVRITACCGTFTEEGLGQLIEPANELLQNISDLHTKVLAPSAMHVHVQDGSLEQKMISMCTHTCTHTHTHPHTCSYCMSIQYTFTCTQIQYKCTLYTDTCTVYANKRSVHVY